MSLEIKGSVGKNGANYKADVRLIQEHLNLALTGKALVIDGDCGDKTNAAITRFQKRFMSQPDGRIDPGGRTLRYLSKASGAVDAEWSGDSSRWSQEKKLESLNPAMRRKVERVVERLEAEGYKPKVVYGWRSLKVQEDLVARGVSRVKFSFHNAQKKNGQPNAYAVDIIDRRYAWSDKAKTSGFWDALGRAAKNEGLYWGGSWRSFKDWAHIQFYPNSQLAEVKKESLAA
jgi:peptidoglycan L-alanyl-D-glutamate endopeptidase CwlK